MGSIADRGTAGSRLRDFERFSAGSWDLGWALVLRSTLAAADGGRAKRRLGLRVVGGDLGLGRLCWLLIV